MPLAGALLLYLALALLLTADAWQAPSTRWIGRCCDQEQTMWFLRWVPTAIERGLDPFVTTQMNAPAGVNLMWNTWSPLIGLALAPVTVTGGPVLAYNVAIVGAITLSAWAGFIALRRYATGVAGPVLGGALYGFSPYVVSHAALHLNLVAVWAPPLFLVLLDELLVRRRRGPVAVGAALGVLAALQLLTSEELLATCAVAATALAVILAVVARDRVLVLGAVRRIAAATVPAGVAFALIAGVPLTVQFLGPRRFEGAVLDTGRFSTDLVNLVLPTRYQLVAPGEAGRIAQEMFGLYHEATAYVGILLLVVLAIVAVTRWSDLRIRVAAIMAAVSFVLSLGPVLRVGGETTVVPLPWWPLAQLPLLEHVITGRLTLYMWLAIAAIVAVVMSELAARGWAQAAPRVAVLGLALALAAPAPLGSSTIEVPDFFRTFGREGIADDAIVLVAPHFTNGAGADPMLWAAVAGNRPRLYEAYAYVPDVDGTPRYGPPPTQLTTIMETIQDTGVVVVARGAVREQVLRDLATTGITDVIVGPMRYRQQMIAFFTDLFGGPPVEVDGVQLWRSVGGPG